MLGSSEPNHKVRLSHLLFTEPRFSQMVRHCKNLEWPAETRALRWVWHDLAVSPRLSPTKKHRLTMRGSHVPMPLTHVPECAETDQTERRWLFQGSVPSEHLRINRNSAKRERVDIKAALESDLGAVRAASVPPADVYPSWARADQLRYRVVLQKAPTPTAQQDAI
jgi:hypothetical protein